MKHKIEKSINSSQDLFKKNINLVKKSAKIFIEKIKITEKFSKLNSTHNLIKNATNDLKNLKKFDIKKFDIKKINYKKLFEIPKKLTVLAQDKLDQSIKVNQEEDLLKQSPLWATSITWTLIGGTALGIIWLGTAKTEEIVIVQGKLEPINKVVDVQIPVGGVVEEVLVEEGDKVNIGQTLINLNNEATQSKMETTKEILELNRGILKDLNKLLDEGAISKVQYIQQKIKVRELENQLIESQVNLKYQKITAPISGTIFELKPTGKGFVAIRSRPILQIVPADNLKAKVEIDSRSIGFVKTGMPVDVSIDSFPASDFGVIEGTVKSIGSDTLPPDPSQGKGYRYPAIIDIKTQYLEIKNNQKLPLQVGMSLTANVKLRKVSYLKLLLGTFQTKAESLKEI